MNPIAHPVLSSEAAKAFEEVLFSGDAEKEWQAMSQAGAAVAHAAWRDLAEVGGPSAKPRLLVLVGKGHNGGDALLAGRTLLGAHASASADIVLVFGERSLRPLTLRAYQQLMSVGADRVRIISSRAALQPEYDLCFDGVFGFQFRPPIDQAVAGLFSRVAQIRIRLRAAVDLPSGLGSPDALRADFTYATGSVKTATLDPSHGEKVGRLRYLDLGFFASTAAVPVSDLQVLSNRTLDPLRGWRAAHSDKRQYGHLFVVGGSRSFPGAVMMSVQAALRSGVGLLTAFVPESLVPAYAAHVPEAMWVGCPETPSGALALEGLHLLRERRHRATAIAIGPGLTQERETLALAADIVGQLELPAVIDADALQPEVAMAGSKPRIVTPHAGEFKRLAGEQSPESYARETGLITVLKGVPTRVTDGRTTYLSLAGGPVLSRGGSGDILAGLMGGLLAQNPDAALGAACAGVLWHGLAADALARAEGAVAVRTTQLLDHLGEVLHSGEYA